MNDKMRQYGGCENWITSGKYATYVRTRHVREEGVERVAVGREGKGEDWRAGSVGI